jgi:hypothetical protein
MQTLTGHFNGQVVILDEPVVLSLNTRVTVIAPEVGENDRELTDTAGRASAEVFAKVWDNSLDADYARL